MARDATRYFVDDERPAVSYGPCRHTDGDAWVLSLSTGDERVEIVLDEQPMYDLWVEVRGAASPNRDRGREDRLVRQLVHAANHADEEMLEDALEALGVGDA